MGDIYFYDMPSKIVCAICVFSTQAMFRVCVTVFCCYSNQYRVDISAIHALLALLISLLSVDYIKLELRMELRMS